MQILTPLKIRTIVFTCNPVTNDNTHHELPKSIYNPKQDRKILGHQDLLLSWHHYYTTLLQNDLICIDKIFKKKSLPNQFFFLV